MRIGAWTLLVCFALYAVIVVADGCKPARSAPRVRINGTTWFVDLAVTRKERYKGLSGRRDLSDSAGMLFIFPDAAIRRFCMRGCYIPLDIAFIGADLKIVRMATMEVEPDRAGRRIYDSGRPAQYVLEVPAGTLARASIAVGDSVELLGSIPDATKAEPDP